jgi:hypothetical protein
MLTVEPLAYARSRQVEQARAARDARLARLARSSSRQVAGSQRRRFRLLTSRLQLKPASPAPCCC